MSNTPATTTNSEAAVPVENPMVAQVRARITNTGRYVGGGAFLAQALGATTLEEATEIGTVVGAKELIGERLRFVDVSFLDSDPDLESAVPFFALAKVVREAGDGTVEKLSCGAEHVLGVLIRAAELDWFPFDAELVSVNLGKGMSAINLQLAPRKVDAWEG